MGCSSTNEVKDEPVDLKTETKNKTVDIKTEK